MMPVISRRPLASGLLLLSLSCAARPGAIPLLSQAGSAEPSKFEQPRQPRSERDVQVLLLECVVDHGVAFEETLPDGRVIESTSGHGTGGVRLHLLIMNLSEKPVFVALCHDGLAILSEDSSKPFCDYLGLVDWGPLPPGGSIHLYPFLGGPFPEAGTFTYQLMPRVHAPIVNWPDYTPNTVSFELAVGDCRPLDVIGADRPAMH
jgi:hypothetical protein